MYIDSDVLYALLKESDWLREYALKVSSMKDEMYTSTATKRRNKKNIRLIFSSMKDEMYTSTATLLELTVVVKRDFGEEFSTLIYEILKKKLPQLKIIPLNENNFIESIELRKKFGLGIYDSINAAIALSKDKKIASTDSAYKKIPSLQII